MIDWKTELHESRKVLRRILIRPTEILLLIRVLYPVPTPCCAVGVCVLESCDLPVGIQRVPLSERFHDAYWPLICNFFAVNVCLERKRARCASISDATFKSVICEARMFFQVDPLGSLLSVSASTAASHREMISQREKQDICPRIIF